MLKKLVFVVACAVLAAGVVVVPSWGVTVSNLPLGDSECVFIDDTMVDFQGIIEFQGRAVDEKGNKAEDKMTWRTQEPSCWRMFLDARNWQVGNYQLANGTLGYLNQQAEDSIVVTVDNVSRKITVSGDGDVYAFAWEVFSYLQRNSNVSVMEIKSLTGAGLFFFMFFYPRGTGWNFCYLHEDHHIVWRKGSVKNRPGPYHPFGDAWCDRDRHPLGSATELPLDGENPFEPGGTVGGGVGDGTGGGAGGDAGGGTGGGTGGDGTGGSAGGAASLSVKTVDELAQNVVKGAVLTLYADTNNNKKFDEADKIVDGAAEQIIADGAKQPAKWDGLPAGSYFVKVVPQSDSRYQERVYYVEHKAENDNNAVTVPLQRASSEVGWEKVDSADTSKYLGGSKWCVKPPQGVSFAQLNVSTEATGECADGVIVEDFEGAAAPGDEAAASDAGDAAGGVQDINALPARVLKDVNPEKGKIAISLPWMNYDQGYTVKEHEAPVLYSKSDTVYQVYVSSAQTEKVEFVKDGYIVAQTAVNGQTKWHKITNERIPQVGVLLDSGVRYLLWALLVAGAAGVWFVVSARRRAAQASRLD